MYTLLIIACIITAYKQNWKMSEAYENLINALDDNVQPEPNVLEMSNYAQRLSHLSLMMMTWSNLVNILVI